MRCVVNGLGNHLGRSREIHQAIVAFPLACGSNGPRAESAATVRAYVIERFVHTGPTESALKGTNHGVK
jgi:hypothetical protein